MERGGLFGAERDEVKRTECKVDQLKFKPLVEVAA
jgi:hypothetical protein